MQDGFTSIWKEICESIRGQVTADAFERWFRSVDLVSADEEVLTLRAPNNIYQFWIESNYMAAVQAAVVKVLGAPRKLRFRFSGESAPEAVVAEAVADALRIEENDHSADGSHRDSLAASGMNPRYTFETFVVGQSNQFGHAAALAVAQSPAKTYNPLFVYGGTGLGKTHLMQAIGQYAARRRGTKVLYISSERFTNEFIDAIQNSTLVKFRKRYRQADILLIDDIQFFAGKERCQEEFFHTFNTLFDGHKQIVMSSDRPASEIQNLEQRLVSRFEWGMTAEMQPPDIETRVAILRKKAEAMQMRIPDAIVEFLAQRIRTSVRRLEGALMRVATYVSLSNGEFNTAAIEHLLKDFLQEEARTVSIDQIQRRVAEHFDVRLADMTSKRRPKHIAFPRQVAMYLARSLTKASLTEIGEAFGGRNHGTVLHACRLVQEESAREEKLRQAVSFLKNQLQR